MSNPTAIGAVTAAFGQLLLGVLEDHNLVGANVTNVPPDVANAAEDGRRLNLFLYEITPNLGWTNMDLPFRGSNGDFVQQPMLAVDLHYLLTAYGESDDPLDAQHLLGHAMSVVHDRSVLSPGDIATAIAALSAYDPFLHDADLADQIEPVRIAPQGLSHDEMSKLWTAFSTNYRLSVGYQASVVLIQRPKRHRSALPVQTRRVDVTPFVTPSIEELTPSPATAGVTLTIRGDNLSSAETRVQFGRLAPLIATIVSPKELTVAIPGGLPIGAIPVQVVRSVETGPGALKRDGRSNVVSLPLVPVITTAPPIAVAPGATLTLDVSPPIERTRGASVVLGDQDLPAKAWPTGAAGPFNSVDVTVPASFAPGIYPARVRVSGFESPLRVDDNPASPSFGQLVPVVQIT
jgi:Pvc16 N-terminal domain/IPT/TIG domain